jgi:quinol monooxygenase YgiN
MDKRFLHFLSALALLISVSCLSLKAQESDDIPYVIIVEFTFSEDHVDQAIEYLLDMQAQTLDNEEGCIAYDVLLCEDDATKIFLYESYENNAAYKKHENSAYFKTIVLQKLKPLIKAQRITKVIPVNNESIEDEEF